MDEVIKLQGLTDQLMVRLPAMDLRDRHALQAQVDPRHRRKGLKDDSSRWDVGFAFVTWDRDLVLL
jgi:hypothetical protein